MRVGSPEEITTATPADLDQLCWKEIGVNPIEQPIVQGFNSPLQLSVFLIDYGQSDIRGAAING